jgi:hypothetical protein
MKLQYKDHCVLKGHQKTHILFFKKYTYLNHILHYKK